MRRPGGFVTGLFLKKIQNMVLNSHFPLFSPSRSHIVLLLPTKNLWEAELPSLLSPTWQNCGFWLWFGWLVTSQVFSIALERDRLACFDSEDGLTIYRVEGTGGLGAWGHEGGEGLRSFHGTNSSQKLTKNGPKMSFCIQANEPKTNPKWAQTLPEAKPKRSSKWA